MKFREIIKNKSNLAYSFLFFISLGMLILAPLSLTKVALALQGRYDRAATDSSITVTDWNYLDDDFLARDGTNAMTGDLNMGGNRITNVGTPSNNTDAATVQYVQNQISASAIASGGKTFINWGRSDCPSGGGITELYHGVAFSARYDSYSGGSNIMCLSSGDAGSAYTSTYSDELYPVTTGDSSSATLPADGSYVYHSMVRCAVCYLPAATCYEVDGTHSCNTSAGFNPVYTGYLLGSNSENLQTGSHRHPTNRTCVNRNYDGSLTVSSATMGAMWYGTKVEDNFGLSYTEDSFIKCAFCCN